MDKRIAVLIQKHKLPQSVYSTLMEFAVAYLKETPRDISDFGIKFFSKKEDERSGRAFKQFGTNEADKNSSPAKSDIKMCVLAGKGAKIKPKNEEGVSNLRRATQLLFKVGIFKYLTSEEIAKLAQNLVFLNFKDGELIFREGDDVCGIIIVDSGVIKLSTAQTNSAKDTLILGKTILGSGDYTDVLSLVCSKPSSFTGLAKGEVNCYYLETAIFDKVVGPCCFYLHRANKRLEWESYIQGNPYLYMLRYELRNFLICYLYQKPKNFIQFGLAYFTEMKETPGQIGFVMNEAKSKDRHPGIAGAGHYQNETNDGEKKFPKYGKSTEQRKLIKDTLTKLLVFKPMEEKELNIIIDSMKRKDVKEGETVVIEGETGDNFFVIESGVFVAFIIRNGIEEIVKTYEEEGCFGELSMMYNTPRNATVKAATDGKLWCLSKEVFRVVVLGNPVLKRKLYENLIEEVPILKSLKPQDRANLADAIETKKYYPGDKIISENEIADGMYFVLNGQVAIRKEDKGEEIHIRTVNKGGYFGELALVTQNKRAASAYALTEVDAAFLDIDSFEKILGPRKHILQRNIELYKRQILSIINNMDEGKNS